MDPISIIVTALATGAAAALKPTTEKLITDAYSSLKAWITSAYRGVEVDVLERDPGSSKRKDLVTDGLKATDAAEDEELLTRAQALIDAVRKYAPSSAEAAGVTIEELEAQSLFIRKLVATGGLKLKGAKLQGDVVFEDLTLGNPGSKS